MSVIKNGIKKALAIAIRPFILHKFFKDSKVLPLEEGHRTTYTQLHTSYWLTFFKFPNLIKCEDYNQKIQWLKLFDNTPLMIKCVDKVLVRDYVTEVLGEGYLPELYQVADSFNELEFSKIPEKFVLKTNHDSGTVFLVKDKDKANYSKMEAQVKRALNERFGSFGGEWPYLQVVPKVFAEEYLDPTNPKPPADYKFHCVNGKVEWLQYIYDRGIETKEVVADSRGKVLDIHFDESMTSVREFERPIELKVMVKIAERLSKAFRYVRVDLYLVEGKVQVGELTFFPMYGCYSGGGQALLGKYMDFDRTEYLSPV
ncbi:MAG: ATP-grasp fold amidoligase family protein [Bermanella sp.]